MLFRSCTAAFTKIAVAAFAFSALATAASAQTLTYVSSTGVDTRPCTVQAQPCKTLQRAATVTSAGGSIRVLSDLPQQTATITKSLSVEGDGHTMIGAISINSASAIVTLRRLNLTGRNSVSYGINIKSAAQVYIENSTVERYATDGIYMVATSATRLFISDTASRASGGDGLYVDAPSAWVEIVNSGFEGNGSSGVYLKVAKANVRHSVASGNTSNGMILVAGKIKVTETSASDNSGAGFLVRTPAYLAMLSSVETSGNGAAGLKVEAGGKAMISHCVFAETASVSGINNEGTLYSFGNNAVIATTGTFEDQQLQ